MEQKNSLTIDLDSSKYKEFVSYCKLNDLDMDEFIKTCFVQGYYIEKNGLLNPSKTGGVQEKWVEKEVIREKRVEVPVEVIKEVVVEKIVEVPVEVIVEKEIFVTDEGQVDELGEKITKLENEKNELLLKIQQLDSEEEKPKLETSPDKMRMLQETIQKLQKELREKSEKITQLEKTILQLQNRSEPRGVYLRSSNLNDNL